MDRRERPIGLRDQIVNQFIETDTQLFEAREIIVGRVMSFTSAAYQGVQEVPTSLLTRDRGISYSLSRSEVRDFAPRTLRDILYDLQLTDRSLYVSIEATNHSYNWKDRREYSVSVMPGYYDVGDFGIEIYSLRKPFCHVFHCEPPAVSYDEEGNEIVSRPIWRVQQDSELANIYNALCEGMTWPGSNDDTARLIGSAGYHEPQADPLLGTIHLELANWIAQTLDSRRRP